MRKREVISSIVIDRAGVKLVCMLVAAGIPLKTTISTSTGSLVTGSSNNARSTTAIETHIMIFVSIETSFLQLRFLLGTGGGLARPTLSKKISPSQAVDWNLTFEISTLVVRRRPASQ